MCVIPSISLPSQWHGIWMSEGIHAGAWLRLLPCTFSRARPAICSQTSKKHWFACRPFVLLKEVPKASNQQNASKCINMPHMDTYWWFNYGSKSKTRKATGLSLCLHSITHPISSNYWGYPTLENTFLGPRSISFGPGHFSWTLLKFFWRWLPFFWTCAPSRWTCAPSCWTWPFPKPRPLWIDSPSCVLVAILQTVEG